MQIVFLIWPIMLLPVLVAWLTRPRPSGSAHAKPHACAEPEIVAAPAQKDTLHTSVYRKEARRAYLEMLELAAEQRRRESPAYRRAAQAAYVEMQTMHDMAGDAPDDPLVRSD